METLYQMSDMTPEEYDDIKKRYIDKGQTRNAMLALLSRSLLPKYRNMVRSVGELYAPVAYTADYIVKLVKKPSWGGWILTLTLWDMMIIDVDADADADADVDADAELQYIKNNISYHYPNDLFYINRTNRGYHIYLVSRRLSHATLEAIDMRINLNGDPAHGTNSLYSGASVRISRKASDPPQQQLPSHYVVSHGGGQPDPELDQLYHIVQSYIKRYGNFQVSPDDTELMAMLQEEWDRQIPDHGLTHIMTTAPFILKNKQPVETEPFTISDNMAELCNRRFKRTIKYKNLHCCTNIRDLSPILLWSHYTICYNNLYRIIKSSIDYAYGVHVQENCYFISYRDLLVVDYDHPRRIQILHRYVKNNPWCTFRLVRTTKGYHAFLTSKPIHHRQGLDLLLRLRSDPLHMLSSFHRGYGVRVNRKDPKERPYRETQIMGHAPEDPRLVELYRLHLELYQQAKDYPIYNVQQKVTASDLL